MKMTAFVAIKRENDFMEQLDLRPKYKFYTRRADVDVIDSITDEEIMRIIGNSMANYEEKGLGIVAVARPDGHLVWYEEMKIMSDGNYEIFTVKKG